MKHRRTLPIGELHPTETPNARWEGISVDFIQEHPDSHGFDAVMVVVDRLSKRAHFLPTHTTCTAEGAAWLFYREVWKHHGLPNDVISDRGTQFVADFTRELYHRLGITISASTAYHPQSDGQTERVNVEVETYLRAYCSYRQDDWDELLPSAEFAYNNHIHSSTQQTPFWTDTGRNPRMGFEPHQAPSPLANVNDLVDRMHDAESEAKAALVKAKDEQARYYNRRWAPTPVFKPGDKVWLDSSDIRTTQPSKKLGHLWWGPYPIERAVGPHAYRLKLPLSMRRLHPVFPVVKLAASPEDPIENRPRPTPPEPVVVDDEVEHEVEEILDSRRVRNKLMYRVRWKGWGPEDDTEEPAENLKHAPKVVEEFHSKHPHAIRSLRLSAAAFASIPFRAMDTEF